MMKIVPQNKGLKREKNSVFEECIVIVQKYNLGIELHEKDIQYYLIGGQMEIISNKTKVISVQEVTVKISNEEYLSVGGATINVKVRALEQKYMSKLMEAFGISSPRIFQYEYYFGDDMFSEEHLITFFLREEVITEKT